MENQKWQIRLRVSLLLIVLGIIAQTGLFTDIKKYGGILLGLGIGFLIVGYLRYKKEEKQN